SCHVFQAGFLSSISPSSLSSKSIRGNLGVVCGNLTRLKRKCYIEEEGMIFSGNS
ncbi:unnamed protein product, partial [Cylicocyclus nassatus]